MRETRLWHDTPTMEGSAWEIGSVNTWGTTQEGIATPKQN